MKKMLWTALIFLFAAISVPPLAIAKEPPADKPKVEKGETKKPKAAKPKKEKPAAEKPAPKCCDGNKKPSMAADSLLSTTLWCPQYPIMQIEEASEETYLYLAYTYEIDGTPEVCPEPGIDYCYGLFLWPMDCFDNCPNSAALAKEGEPEPRQMFPGLKEPVTLLHEMTTADPFDVKWYPNKLPAGMARASIRKAALPEEKTFLRYRPTGIANELYFKLFRLDPATTAEDDSDHFFVALQLSDADSRKVADSAIGVTHVADLAGGFAYVVEVQLDAETVKKVLVLRTR